MERRRVIIIGILTMVPFLGLAGRLVDLQVVRGGEFRRNLEARRQHLEFLPSTRGRILDRKGVVLAEDRISFDVYIVPAEFDEEEDVTRRLSESLGLEMKRIEDELERIYRKIESRMMARPERERPAIYTGERKVPRLLMRNIEREAALRIETAPGLFRGVAIRESLRRFYPQGPLGAHGVGYVGRFAEKELNESDWCPGLSEVIGEQGVETLKRRDTFLDQVIGRSGVEKQYDARLRGQPGAGIAERDSELGVSSVTELVSPVSGEDVSLTIDIRLQEAVEKALSACQNSRGGAAIVMDLDGAIRAMASWPTFDPNHFVPPADPRHVDPYLNGLEKPLRNRSLASYPLGSIFKVVTATAGLQEGRIMPGTLLLCNGRFSEKLSFLSCWIGAQGGAHGELDMRQALAQSCNCYFFHLGRMVGGDGLIRWATFFGFGEPSGVDLPFEARGQLPGKCVGLDVLNLSIGQSKLMATLLQAVRVMGVVATGGSLVTPYVTLGAGGANQHVPMSTSTLAVLREGLRSVVKSPEGTAHRRLAGFDTAGKTSSAETRKGLPTHAWFAGYFPESAPRYSYGVMIEYGGHGGDTAAAVAAELLRVLD